MNKGKLNGADFKTFLAQLAQPHTWYVSVDLLTAEGEQIVSFDPHRAGDRDVIVSDAAVQVTPEGRALTMTVADPNKVLLIGQQANYTDRQFQVHVGVDVPALGLAHPVWTDVFTGPIVSAPRSGDVIQFTAHGKERYGKHGIRDIYVVKKGTPVTTAIKRILAVLTGEYARHMGNIPDLRPVLQDDLVIHVKQRPIDVVRNLADGLERFIAYDGSGNVHMPKMDATDPVYTFTSAQHRPGVIGDDPEVTADWTLIRNAVRRTGVPPKGGGAAPEPGLAYADADNPFSAQRQGRNGADAYFWDDKHMPNVHTHHVLQQLANQALRRDLTTPRQVKLECLPMPCFDYGDLVQVINPGLVVQLPMQNFTIPLNLEGSPTMSVGWNSRVSSNAFARRAG